MLDYEKFWTAVEYVAGCMTAQRIRDEWTAATIKADQFRQAKFAFWDPMFDPEMPTLTSKKDAEAVVEIVLSRDQDVQAYVYQILHNAGWRVEQSSKIIRNRGWD